MTECQHEIGNGIEVPGIEFDQQRGLRQRPAPQVIGPVTESVEPVLSQLHSDQAIDDLLRSLEVRFQQQVCRSQLINVLAGKQLHSKLLSRAVSRLKYSGLSQYADSRQLRASLRLVVADKVWKRTR